MRPQRFNFPPQVSWKQIVGADSQNFGKDKKFNIRHAPLLIFQPGDGESAGIPPKQLRLYGKLVLRPALLLAQLAYLGANHIQLFGAVFYAWHRSRRQAETMFLLLNILFLHFGEWRLRWPPDL